ncbi:MAG TPA: hypothetical protein VHY91_19220 [Pirellulales bacterium]|jgi:hypothetical protein|nr:hypothetical protein [Pirellulales bacterium]
MHARQLVEVAALVASHGPVLVEGKAVISHSALEQYWATSKCRCERWLRSVKRLAAYDTADDELLATLAAEIRPLLEEIFLSEMVLRVWTAILYAYDRRRGTNDAEPVAQNVLSSHLEVRARALVLLVHSPLLDGEEAVLLNRMRRRMERWTDLLLGHLHGSYNVSELGFDADRVVEFSADLKRQPRKAAQRQAWGLTLAALRLAFERGLAEASPNTMANHDIAASILACFPSDVFESTGMLRGLWLVRMAHATDDAQGMIASLLENAPRRRGVPAQPLRFDGPAPRRF